MQWIVLTEEKQKNELAQTEVRFIKAIIIIRGGKYSLPFASISALHCSKRRVLSRWPYSADKSSGVHRLKEKQKNELAQTEFRFIKTIMIIRGGNYL